MRYMQNSLLKNEEFCLQIDAHTDVIPHWDNELLEMWGGIQNEYGILSTSVPDIPVLTQESNEVHHLCQATVDSR